MTITVVAAAALASAISATLLQDLGISSWAEAVAALTVLSILAGLMGLVAGWFVDRRIDAKLAPMKEAVDRVEHQHERNGGALTNAEGRVVDGTTKDIAAQTLELLRDVSARIGSPKEAGDGPVVRPGD